jgi:hypothetical protein
MRPILAMLLLAALPGAALAGDESPAPASSDGDLHVENGAFVIKGKVQKPQVVVVVRRQTLDQGIDLELKESFLHKIVDVTEEPPF